MRDENNFIFSEKLLHNYMASLRLLQASVEKMHAKLQQFVEKIRMNRRKGFELLDAVLQSDVKTVDQLIRLGASVNFSAVKKKNSEDNIHKNSVTVLRTGM